MMEERRVPGEQPESWALAVPPNQNGSRVVETAMEPPKDAYALALETIERLFFEQRARITEELESARTAAEESDFKDYKSISIAATCAVRMSWDADDQIAGLKKRLDELCQQRVGEPIMELRQLSTKMEERN